MTRIALTSGVTPLVAGVVLLAAVGFGCGEKAEPSASQPASESAPEPKPGTGSASEPGSAIESAEGKAVEPAPKAEALAAPGENSGKPVTAQEAASGGAPRPVVLGLERFGEVKQHASFTLAASWVEAPKWGKASFLPKAELESMEPAVLQLSTTCGGECSPAKTAGNVKEALAGRVESSKRPNQNTGDAALDAVRAQVEVTKSQVADGLAIQAIRITYDEELMKKGPYRPRFLVDCYAWRPADEYFVQITASGPLASEPTHLETILAMCQTLKAVDAPSADASRTSGSKTWTDTSAGKIWQNPPAAKAMTWQEANDYCSTLELDGTGWRLPTITELRSLVRGCPTVEPGGQCKVEEGGCLAKDCRKACDSCPTGKAAAGAYWPEGLTGDSGRHWSSTAVQDVPGKVWVLDFGHAGLKTDSQDNQHQVRCVR